MLDKMADLKKKSRQKGTIICQNGEIDLEDPAIEEGFADMKAAIMTGRTDILRILLSAAQSYRDDDELFAEEESEEDGQRRALAEEEEVLDLLQMLLNFRDNDAGTGLHYATKLDKPDMVRSLLAAGANPTLKNLEGSTSYDYCKSDQMKTAYVGALMQAVAQSNVYRVKLLLQAGVDVNSGDNAESDNKVLHWAASFADVKTLKVLLDANADVNVVNSDGSTPLHDAIARGDKEIITELLKFGAIVNTIPFKGPMEGKSCYDLAIDKDDIRMLLDVHLLTTETTTNGNCDESDASTKEEPSENSPVLTQADQSGPILEAIDQSHSSENQHLILHTEAHKVQSLTEKAFKPILLPPKSPMRLFLPSLTQLDPGVLQLWPAPQKILQYKGTSYVPPLQLIFILRTTANMKPCQLTEFSKIIQIMQPKFQNIGLKTQMEVASAYSDSYIGSKGCVECFLDSSNILGTDEYQLQVSTRKVKIIGSNMKSVFFAINTLLQCLRIFQGRALPLLQISDSSDTRIRGVQLDFSNGDIPKFANLLHFIDILAGFKINQIYVPVQLFLPDNQKIYHFYNQSDLLQLHNFCEERYINVVPALRSSDVLDPVNAYSLSFIKTEILPMFPYSRFISMSLGNSESFIRDSQNLLSGITDSELVRRIEEFHLFCATNDLALLIDSEMILQQPVKLMEINQNLICLNLLRNGKEDATCDFLRDLCVANIICPRYKSDQTILNDVKSSLKYFENCQTAKSKSGSIGMVFRLESKSSNLACATLDIVPVAIAAGMAWRSSPPVTLDDSMISNIINRHIYQDDKDVISGIIMTLSSLEQISLISKESDGDELSPIDESTRCGQLKFLLNVMDDLPTSCVSFENLKLMSMSLKQLESNISQCKIRSPLKEMVISEMTSISQILSFLCRVGLALQKHSSNDRQSTIGNMTQIQKSDLCNKLMNLYENYEAYCTAFYKQTVEDQISIQIIKKLLKRLHPEKESSFLKSITRTFTA